MNPSASATENPSASHGRLRFFDAHNHLQDERFGGRWDELIDAARAVGVERMVVNGSCEEDWPVVAMLAERFPEVIPGFGYHPWYLGERTPAWREALIGWLDRTPGAVVGEIGVDRWMLENPDRWRRYRQGTTPFAGDPPDWALQESMWVDQLELAAARGLPVTIHCLRAFGRLLEVLANGPRPGPGFLLHSYGGPVELVDRFAELGGYFGFPGSALDPRRQRQQEVFRRIPIERLLVETDAPDQMPPESHRPSVLTGPSGSLLNVPANLPAIHAGLAELTGRSLESLTGQLAENFHRFFGSIRVPPRLRVGT
ncbi:MAG: TatD family hydrolase [Verrucomicrobiota bacterium]